jgi:hypothetical protein
MTAAVPNICAAFSGTQNHSRFFSGVVTTKRLPCTISNLPERKRLVFLLIPFSLHGVSAKTSVKVSSTSLKPHE